MEGHDNGKKQYNFIYISSIVVELFLVNRFFMPITKVFAL